MGTQYEYKNAREGLKLIYKEEGFLAYWRGNGLNILNYFPKTAVCFTFNDFYKRKLQFYSIEKEG